MTKKTPAKNEPGSDKQNIGKWVGAGAAVGIGSAAVVAALLYTRKARDGAKSAKAPPPVADAED